MKYVQSQLLLVELQVNEPHIEFSPSFHHIWELIHRVFMEIIRSAEELPRVRSHAKIRIFPELMESVIDSEFFIFFFLNESGGM